jgi:hypothetical protein
MATSFKSLREKQDACYNKVKSRYKVWPSAYASGALVKCRKKGAANWGNKTEDTELQQENLRKWFQDKWVRFGPDGKIRGDCARDDSSEGKPKCLPQSQAHALGKQGRARAAARKRRQDPDAERRGAAINVQTEQLQEPKNMKSFREIREACKQALTEAPAWTRKEGKSPSGGLNRKGIASYRRANPGSKLSMAVTTPPSKLDPDSKAAKRRKSFCARMGGVEGPMEKDGKPTRKALALRKWNC